MNSLDIIKEKIQKLYNTQPNIHINLSINRPKVSLTNVPVVMKGVYPHFFQVEDRSSGVLKYHTFQYADVLTKQVEILELSEE